MPATRSPGTPRRPTGRRVGDSGTRDAILAAARRHFAHEGYTASLRSIAATAGVDVALIRHFFGNKEELFDAIIEIPEGTEARLLDALAGDPATLGERLVRAYLELWEDPASGEPLRAIARTALTTHHTTEHLRDLLTQRLLNPNLSSMLGQQRESLIALASAQLMGIALARNVVRTGPLVDMDIDSIAALVGPSLQNQLAR